VIQSMKKTIPNVIYRYENGIEMAPLINGIK